MCKAQYRLSSFDKCFSSDKYNTGIILAYSLYANEAYSTESELQIF